MVFIYAFLFVAGFGICSYLFGCCITLVLFLVKKILIGIFRLIGWILKTVWKVICSVPRIIRYLVRYISVLIDMIRYEHTSYYKETNHSYLDVITDKGINGEYRCFKKLRYLEKEGARFLFNLYLPKDDGTTSELDILMIHCTGLYILESKSRKGKVIGDPSAYTWKQITDRGCFDMFNPLFQNEGHVKALRGMISDEVNIQPMTVFTHGFELMNADTEYPVCTIQNLENRMESLLDSFPVTISDQNVDYLYERLKEYEKVNTEASVRKSHVDYCRSFVIITIRKCIETAQVVHEER